MKSKIYSIYIILSTILASLALQPLQAQPTFSTPDTIKFLYKDTGFNTLHEYLEVVNLTGDSLNMRWKQHRFRYTSGWTTTLQDPTQWHNPVDGVDSADFVLPDSVSAPFRNKLIIGVDHHGITGKGVAIFTVFEIGHPEDSVRLYFDITVTPKIGLPENTGRDLKIYPNPARGTLYLASQDLSSEASITLSNAAGQNFPVQYLSSKTGTRKIAVDHLAPGLYIVSVLDNDRRYHQKVYLY